MSGWLRRLPTARLLPGNASARKSSAVRLGVSRQPISHALQMLKQQKLVEGNGRRGLIVSEIDAVRVRELYQVRSALDALAAQLAAERIAGRIIETQERRAAQQALAAGLALRPDTSVLTFIQADVAFHTALPFVRQPGNRRHCRGAMAPPETLDGRCA
jgi:DNA-binding GntR family transcriptional regulator